MRLTSVALCAALVASSSLASPNAKAQTVGVSSSNSRAIIAVLDESAADWNRGDIDAFATSYKNSADILFMGKTIQHGYAQMLARYKASYPSRAAMGTLSFTSLEVQPLDTRFATVTGHYHLERTREGGGAADGFFLLVMEKTSTGWKIVRDDTTNLPAAEK
jgi:ketosteroid isomerase-like protein